VKLGVTPWDFSDRSARGLAEQAARAEALGYQSLWIPESHFGAQAIPEPLLLLAAMAAATSRIRLGTTSFLLTLRNPVQAAEQVAVLDQLCGGRLTLGVGRGYAAPVLRAFEVDPRSKRTLFEQRLTEMRRMWSGGPITEGGATETLEPLPAQRPHPPIWVAAFGPKALEQAGRLGLPYLASPVETLAELARNYMHHAAAAAAAGHPPVATIPVMRTVFVTRDARETADVRARVQAEAERSGRLAAGARVADWALIGEASEVRELADEYRRQLGVTELIVTRLRVGGVSAERMAANAAEALAALT
jgi:alkanesulfonate monooxygenase SsuD/methylene tetrahydromethanopterin reductase-like flavin-dependent oxidoreductase (luciferase family)